ncbi:hypothetical protein BDR26DRAFT_866909 [Obelidium mucronatum]|nr:hypothetical protein BDR26DRAFT_866909 [Obelidium mucronatum]
MHVQVTSLFSFLFCIVVSLVHCNPHRQFTVLHATSSRPFTPRGLITHNNHGLLPVYQPTSRNDSISNNTATALLYHLKLISDSGIELKSSIRLCLLDHLISESFTIHFDETGAPFHLDYSVELSQISCAKSTGLGQVAIKLSELKDVTTRVEYVKQEEGSRPRLEQITAELAAGKENVEKTFFQKYWIFVIPAVILLIRMGSEQKEDAATK